MMSLSVPMLPTGGDAMKRTQIQLDDRTYEKLRRRAFEKGCSISSYVREVLASALGTAKAKQKLTIRDFKFVGAGGSRQGGLAPVSERHDEALAEALAKGHRR
jgi:plasmid stability protein